MRIEQVQQTYPDYKISYLPKDVYDTHGKCVVFQRHFFRYDEIYIASKKRKHWLIYPTTGQMIGIFKTKTACYNYFNLYGR